MASRPVTHLGPRRAAPGRRPARSSGRTAFRRTRSIRRCKTVLREVQQLKGSCPFLYAFDGARWHFVTDVLGRAPAGLLYDGVHQAAADTREWLVVPGDWLTPDGRQRSRSTSPRSSGRRPTSTWPSSRAVDHPAGVALVAEREDGAAAVSRRRGSSPSSRPLDAAGRRRRRAATARAEIAARGRRLPRGLRADALPGHRRAARARARAARGARGRGRSCST